MMRLILLGGGYSHVSVLDTLAKQPLSDVAVTLVSPYPQQMYAGMLPGWLAGHYRLRECVIPIEAIAQRGGAAFRRNSAIGIDTAGRRVLCADGTTIPYDVLSIDTGAVLDLVALPGAAQHVLPVRPIERFVKSCRSLVQQVLARPRSIVTMIGGGVAGIELTLALQHRLRRHAQDGKVVFQVVDAGERLLPSHPPRVGRALEAMLTSRGILLYAGRSVAAFHAGGLVLHTGEEIESDFNLAATGASAPAWPATSGLAVDGRGFILVNEFLQSASHANIFAAGDVASLAGQTHPRSGAHALRAGPTLAENLRFVLDQQPLRRHVPQKHALQLIYTGERHAVASWGPVSWRGDWVWRWKDRIDRAFIARHAASRRAEMNQFAPDES
jgi:selenide,water dikinase